jgi:hypothetical protein
LEGEQKVNTRGNYLAAVMFVCSLFFPINALFASAQETGRPLRACEQVFQDKSKLQRDQKRLETDVGSLRKSLRHHASQGQIERLRHQVQQDWNQIVLDRGPSKPVQVEQTPNLANGTLIKKLRATDPLS